MLHFELKVESRHPAQVFMDLFYPGSLRNGKPRQVAATDSGSWTLSHCARENGEYLLRIQPELLQEISYSINIHQTPSLGFPVLGKSTNHIRSRFGAPRDGGRRKHKGVDIFAPRGTPAIASVPGRISTSKMADWEAKLFGFGTPNIPKHYIMPIWIRRWFE